MEDCVDAIFSIIKKGQVGESYNIGSGEQISNIAIAESIIKIIKPDIKTKKNLIEFVEDRPA